MRITRARTARRLKVRAVILAIVVATVARAQAPITTPIRLGEIYAQVQRANPKLAAARALVRAARARTPAASRLPDPQLQLGFMNYSLPSLSPMPPLGMTQLQLMQMVPLGGKLGLAGRIAGAQADATSERAENLVWDLRSQTAAAFYDLYATDRQLGVARETLTLLEAIAHTAESMYRVGEGRQADVLRAQVEIAKMVEDTLRLEAARETMVSRLNALLNRGASEEIGVVLRPAFPDSMPDHGWLDSVSANGRPMIRAGLKDAQAADATAALARKAIIPDLQIGVQYGQRNASTTEAGGVSAATTERMGSLMIAASIPVFARDRQLRMRNEADAMKAAAQADVDAMRADTRGRIGEAYADLRRSRDLARLYRTTVLPQAEATVSSALSSYRVGKLDFMTLLDDQMTVNKYRQELSALEADEGKAWAELEMLTGRELIDVNSTGVVARADSPMTGGDR
jgi:outer membrane protein TolC